MADDAERITGLYDRHARSWDGERGRSLFERRGRGSGLRRTHPVAGTPEI